MESEKYCFCRQNRSVLSKMSLAYHSEVLSDSKVLLLFDGFLCFYFDFTKPFFFFFIVRYEKYETRPLNMWVLMLGQS